MEQFKNVLLVSAIASALALTACGGGGGSSSDSSGGGGTDTGSATSVGGVVEVPAASISAFADQGSLAAISNFFISPAAAAVLGLEPVEGALVELIRIDNDGNQIGDPIDTTYTSITGDYELELPSGVDLSGDLVVRISGTNNATMTAMVVEQDIDINPISDFIARKFIESDADLAALEVTEVVELRGQAEEFDLTADPSADIEAMLAILERELGEFVESGVTNVTTEDGDTSTIAGDYRSSAFSFDLHDSDNGAGGTLGIEIWINDFAFASDSGGDVSITIGSEEGADAGLTGYGYVWFDTWTETMNETFPGSYLANGLLTIESQLEEELDTDDGYGWRWLPIILNLQQVDDKGLFVLLSQEASARYALTEDKTGIDPEAKEGDEISRAIEIFARKPSGMTDADLAGDFGRVYIESYLDGSSVEVLTETNVLTFDGAGSVDSGALAGHRISISPSGPYYETLSDTASADLPVELGTSGDGDIVSIDGEQTDGFINDTFDFISIVSGEGTEGSYGQVGQTLMVKLPTSKPSVADKRYRLMAMSMGLTGNTGDGSSEVELNTSQFNTFLTMDSETEATVEGRFTNASITGLMGNMGIERSAETETLDGASVAVESNGAVTITIPEGSDSTTMEGFFNEDASMALLTHRYGPASGDPNEMGLVVLIEVTE
ncbi:hypothetical protein ACJO2E_03540 [Marinobacter sp. M1N3S26]|uniref:hypothetical protein n=1 Tax=Marinobacter sp. M1N3S26 TaxID=3382299 RepID=UPI00387AADA9